MLSDARARSIVMLIYMPSHHTGSDVIVGMLGALMAIMG